MPEGTPAGRQEIALSRSARAIAAWGLGVLAAGGPAQAESCGGALGLSSQNIHRGIALSEGRISAFGDLHCPFAEHWVAGIGANTIRTPQGRDDVQVTAYLDRRWRLGDAWSAKLGLIHYEPLQAGNRAGFQYDELIAALGWNGRWLATLAWSPRAGNAYIGEPAGDNGWLRVETAWRQSLGGRFSLDAGLGHAHPSGAPPQDYQYASLTINAAFGDAYVSLGRIWTGPRRLRYETYDPAFEFTFPAGRRWLGSVVWLF
jgi:hypothetical protein